MEPVFKTNYIPGRTIEMLTKERILERISRTPTESFKLLMKLNRLATTIKWAQDGSSKRGKERTVSQEQNHEIIKIWAAFEAYDVHYIICGDLAKYYYDSTMHFTNEFDFYIEDNTDNRSRLSKAMEHLCICKKGFFETIELMPGWLNVYYNGFVLNFFTQLNVKSERTFGQCFELASFAQIEDVAVKFLHLNHLLESKRAANRPKDQIDVLALEEIKKAKEERGEM